jgi:hypothetical protein
MREWYGKNSRDNYSDLGMSRRNWKSKMMKKSRKPSVMRVF